MIADKVRIRNPYFRPKPKCCNLGQELLVIMDFGKENWQIERKSRFAGDVVRSDAVLFNASNRLNIASHYDKEEPATQTHNASVELGSSKKHSSTFSRTGMFRKAIDMDKLRVLMTRAQARQTESMKKDNQMASLVFERSRLPRLNSQSKGNNLQTSQPSNDSEDVASSQECCRALCFDDIQEFQEPEDLTMPLDMMDMTAMISGASILRAAAVQHREEQVQNRHKIESKLCIPTQNDNIDAQEDFRLHGKDFEKQLNSKEFELVNRGNQKVAVPSRISQPKVKINNSVTAKENVNKKPHEKQLNSTEFEVVNRGNQKVAVPSRISEPNVKIDNSVTAKENVNKKPLDKARIQKRRSAIPSLKHTPRHKMNDNLNFRSLTKLAKFSENKFSQRNLTKGVVKVGPHSNGKKNSRRSVVVEIPKIYVCPPEPQVVEEKIKLPQMCDASTSTKIFFTFGRSPDRDLVKETERLTEELEEIARHSCLIREQTIARRQKMQESRVLESFMTSVSPLKRLSSMIQEKPSFVNEASPSCSKSCEETNMVTDTNTHEMVTYTSANCKDESVHFEDCGMEVSNEGSITQNESLMDCSILNTTSDLNSCQMKWKQLKLNSRIFQTPSSRPKRTVKKVSIPVEEEKFEGKLEEDLSPFTEMAGDCERPSLAPMTPHSHHQVSMIKMSLRKQLNQLYDS